MRIVWCVQVIEWLGLGVNLVEEGIFRKSGSLKKQQELMERLQTGEELRLEERQYRYFVL